MTSLEDIRIRDPFIFSRQDGGALYLYGTTDPDPWEGAGVGFDCYRADDLDGDWEGPFRVFTPPRGFWGTTQFWAPEVHEYRGRYFMFATFAGPNRLRGTQVLMAESPEGPFLPWSDGPITPPQWQCLDGTLFIDDEGDPWIVFCHEWLQVHDGTMLAHRLSDDLRHATGRPYFLFSASEAPWARPLKAEGRQFPSYVTDGPFLFRSRSGHLLMTWSSRGDDGYAIGVARSRNGSVLGPWSQDPAPLWTHDGGHGMILRARDGRLRVVLHQPNVSPLERVVLRTLVDTGSSLRLEELPLG